MKDKPERRDATSRRLHGLQRVRYREKTPETEGFSGIFFWLGRGERSWEQETARYTSQNFHVQFSLIFYLELVTDLPPGAAATV